MTLLSREQEAGLIASWRAKRDEQSMTRLIKAFTPLVKQVVFKFRRSRVPEADLMQEGFLGFMTAVDKFKPELGHRLGTYARWWILNAVVDAVIAQSGPIHPGKSVERRRMFFTGDLYMPTVSFDAAVPGTNLTIADVLPTEGDGPAEIVEASLERAHWNGRLWAAVDALPERERKILKDRWLSEDEATLDRLGAELGISKERVRQIEVRALDEIKRQLTRAPALA